MVSLGLEQNGNVNTIKNYSVNLCLLIFPIIKVALSMKIQNSTLIVIVKIIFVAAQFYIKVVVQDTFGLWWVKNLTGKKILTILWTIYQYS